jgi:uncharacterized membrane-anchored protein
MNVERVRRMVSGLSRYELTELEQRFVQSVEQYFKQEGMLTEQQESILEGLYNEKTRWGFIRKKAEFGRG